MIIVQLTGEAIDALREAIDDATDSGRTLRLAVAGPADTLSVKVGEDMWSRPLPVADESSGPRDDARQATTRQATDTTGEAIDPAGSYAALFTDEHGDTRQFAIVTGGNVAGMLARSDTPERLSFARMS